MKKLNKSILKSVNNKGVHSSVQIFSSNYTESKGRSEFSSILEHLVEDNKLPISLSVWKQFVETEHGLR